jgi:hypothetical protein
MYILQHYSCLDAFKTISVSVIYLGPLPAQTLHSRATPVMLACSATGDRTPDRHTQIHTSQSGIISVLELILTSSMSWVVKRPKVLRTIHQNIKKPKHSSFNRSLTEPDKVSSVGIAHARSMYLAQPPYRRWKYRFGKRLLVADYLQAIYFIWKNSFSNSSRVNFGFEAVCALWRNLICHVLTSTLHGSVDYSSAFEPFGPLVNPQFYLSFDLCSFISDSRVVLQHAGEAPPAALRRYLAGNAPQSYNLRIALPQTTLIFRFSILVSCGCLSRTAPSAPLTGAQHCSSPRW